MRDDGPPLTSDLLLQAYRMGVFPMSENRDDPDVFWVDPRMRGIIPIGGFHMSRSLAKRLRSGGFAVSFDRAFADVVRGCAARPETWINDTIFDLYCELHHKGHAHSTEVWKDNHLVGGVYGLSIGGAFFGESMFSRTTDASKIALAYLMDRLATQGFVLFDTQFLTDHLARLGGIEIPREAYHRYLAQAVIQPVRFDAGAPVPTAQDVIQRNAQTS